MALKDIIDGIDDRVISKIEIPEWKDKEGKPIPLFVRSWSAGDRAAYERAIGKDPDNSVALTVIYCLCDEQGSPVYDPKKDLPLVQKKNIKALLKIVNQINSLFITAEEIEALKKSS